MAYWSQQSDKQESYGVTPAEFTPDYGVFEGFGNTALNAATIAARRGGFALSVATGGILSALGDEEGADESFQHADKWLESIRGSYQEAAGVGSQILLGAADVIGTVAAGGPIGGGIMQGATRSAEEVKNNRSLGTAYALGGVNALSIYAGARIPAAWGSTLAQKIGTGALGNVGVGVGQRAAEYGVLKAASLDGDAESVQIFGPANIAADIVLGAAFGGLAHVPVALRDSAESVKRVDNIDSHAPSKPVTAKDVSVNRKALEEVAVAEAEGRAPELGEAGRIFDERVAVINKQAADEVVQLRARIAQEKSSALSLSLERMADEARMTPDVRGPLDATKDDLVTAIRKLGGVDLAEAKSEGIDPADILSINKLAPGKPAFSNKGKTPDQIGEALFEAGYYKARPSKNEVIDDITAALSGQKRYSLQYSGEKQIFDIKAIASEAKTTPKKIYEALDKLSKKQELSVKEQAIIESASRHIEKHPAIREKIREGMQAIRDNRNARLAEVGNEKLQELDPVVIDHAIPEDIKASSDNVESASNLAQDVDTKVELSDGRTAEEHLAEIDKEIAAEATLMDRTKQIMGCLLGGGAL